MTYLEMDTGLSAKDVIQRAKQKKDGKLEEKIETADVEETAREALKKNKLSEEAEHKTEKETFERIVAIEGLRKEVSILEDFMNDPANREIVEDSPELAASLRNKRRALDAAEQALDEDGSRMATSIEGVAAEVHEEMRVQYLIDNKRGLADFKIWFSDIGRGSQRRHFVRAFNDVDGSINSLPWILNDDEISPSTRKRITEKFKETAASNLLATKKESKGDFDGDYAVWKDFYISLHDAAGVQAPNGRTNENIVFGKYQHSHPYEFNVGVFESENPMGVLNKQADEHKQYFNSLTGASSTLQKAKGAEGFMGFGTLRKKLDILRRLDMSFDVGLLQSGNYWRYTTEDREKTISIEELNRRLDSTAALASSKIEEAQRMNKVYDVALQKAPEIMQVTERTPVVLMWKAELYQHVAAKMDELEKRQ